MKDYGTGGLDSAERRREMLLAQLDSLEETLDKGTVPSVGETQVALISTLTHIAINLNDIVVALGTLEAAVDENTAEQK